MNLGRFDLLAGGFFLGPWRSTAPTTLERLLQHLDSTVWEGRFHSMTEALAAVRCSGDEGPPVGLGTDRP